MSNPTSQYAPGTPTNTMAIVSLVTGIVSWLALPLLAGIVAVITGHMARNQIKQSHGLEGGDGLAMVGLILGYLNLVVSCILPILIFGGIISIGGICGICGTLFDPGGFDVSNIVIPPISFN